MAERTHTILDDLIDQFCEMTYPDPATGDERPVNDNREDWAAWDACVNVSRAFCELADRNKDRLQAAGFVVHRVWLGDPRFDKEHLDFDACGYMGRDRISPSQGDETSSEHCVVLASREGEQFLIDFSAAQYGYLDEFPLVHRSIDGVEWDREWEQPRPQLSAPTDLDDTAPSAKLGANTGIPR